MNSRILKDFSSFARHLHAVLARESTLCDRLVATIPRA
jgi:hypothetical protein